MTSETQIRVVVYQEGKTWFAQGIDLDIAAQADTMEGALRRFDTACIANVSLCRDLGKDPMEAIGPAPKPLEAIWSASKMTITPKTPLKSSASVVFCEAA